MENTAQAVADTPGVATAKARKRPRHRWIKWAIALSVVFPLVTAALFKPLKFTCAARLLVGQNPKECLQANTGRDFDQVVEVSYFRNSADDVVKLQIPEGFIDRWVTGPNISGTRADVYLHASGIQLMPESLDNETDFKFPKVHAHEVRFRASSLYRLSRALIEERTQEIFQFHLRIDTTPCQYKHGEQQIYGLTRRVVDIESCPKTREFPRDDIYYAKHPDGRLRTVLRCSAAEIAEPPADKAYDGKASLMPRCEQKFFLPEFNAWVSLTYARLHLPQWQSLEQTAVLRLLSFVSPEH